MTRPLLTLAAILALCARANAAPRELTLEEALALASQRNATLEAARAHVSVAVAGVRQAWVALLPQLALQGKYTHNYREVSIDFPTGGAGSPAASIVIQPLDQLDGAAALTVPLVAPAAYPALEAAKRSRQSAEADFASARATILFSTAQTFFAAAGADEVVAARQSAIEVAKRTLKDAQTRLRAGATNAVEGQRAELALVRAEQALDEALYARDQTYRALATIIELREPFKVRPATETEEPAAENGQTEIATALRLRPEVVSLEQSVLANQSQVLSAKLRWAPTLNGFGNARLINYRGFTGDKYSWAIGLELDWLLYDGGARDAQRLAFEAQVRDSAARLRLEQETVGDEVTNAEQARATRQRALAAAERGVGLARKTLELVRVQQSAGTATQLDLLTAQDSLVVQELAVAQARFDLALARLTLERTTGRFPKPVEP